MKYGEMYFPFPEYHNDYMVVLICSSISI